MTTAAFEVDLRQEDGTGVVAVLVTLTHSSLTAPIYISSDPTEIATDHPRTYKTVSRGLDFTFLPMRVRLPGSTPDAPPRAQLVVDNVDFAVERALNDLGANERVKVKFEVMHSSDWETPQIELPNLELANIRAKGPWITGDLSFDGGVREFTPGATFNRVDFPGLFRR